MPWMRNAHTGGPRQCDQTVSSPDRELSYDPRIFLPAEHAVDVHLGPFIERHEQLGQLLRRASRTRSARKSSENFLSIVATILSLEILASKCGLERSLSRSR